MRSRDRGSAPIEFIWLTLLLLVPLVYVMVAVFETQRAAYGVSAASQAAARAFTQAPDVRTGEIRAQQAARIALADQGVSGASVAIDCRPAATDCLTPGSSVRVVVSVHQPLPLAPSVFGERIGGISVDSTHTEPFGSFRATP